MARDYARIMTAIWRNREFRALDEAPQRVYLLLVTQPDISAAGVLHLRMEWWAEMASDSRADVLAKHLRTLETGRFIIVDRTAGEVLIRSFIRWDAGFNNPKRKPVIIRAAEDVCSPRIAAVLAAEFQRVGLPALDSDALSGSHADTPPHDDGPDGGVAGHSEASSQVNRLSGSEPGSEPQFDGLAVTSVGRSETANHNPQSTLPPRDAADEATAADDSFEEFWATYPRKVKKVDARKAWKTVLRRKVRAEHVIKAALRHAERWREIGKDVEFIPYPATWLRGGSYDDEPEPIPAQTGGGARTSVPAPFGWQAMKTGTDHGQPGPQLRALPGGDH